MYLQWNRCLTNRKTWESHNLQAPILIILGERWTSTSTSALLVFSAPPICQGIDLHPEALGLPVDSNAASGWFNGGQLRSDDHHPTTSCGVWGPRRLLPFKLPIFGGCVSWNGVLLQSRLTAAWTLPCRVMDHPRPTPRYESVEDLGNLSSCRHGMVASMSKSVGDFNTLQIPNWGITRPGKHT